MTCRAVLLGMIGAALVCAFGYFNDFVLRQTLLVGNHLPMSVYGGLVIFVLLVNPLLLGVFKRLALSGCELAVVVVLTLSACCVPGLMRTFTLSALYPHHLNRVYPGWEQQHILDLVPEEMLADPSRNVPVALNGFVQGLGPGEKDVGFLNVPWYAWKRPLMFWLPVILSLWIGLIGLSIIVHRQWADHEQLPYPLANFSNSLLPGEGTSTSILRNRLFWLGCVAMLLLHLNNYMRDWWPERLIEIPREFSFSGLSSLFPTFNQGNSTTVEMVYRARIYFIVVAFAYFLSANVSFSIGIGPMLFGYVTGLLVGYGVSLTGGNYMALKIQTFLNFGAFLGMFLVLIYTGRHYYAHTFRKVLLLPSSQQVEPASVWGGRVFLLSMAVLVASLVATGLDWQLAVLYVCGVVVLYVVLSRVLVETGMFFIQAYWFPCVILWGILGARALGPQALLIMMMFSCVLVIDPRESLMPFIVNSLKLLDLRKVKIGRTAAVCAATVVLGLAVGIPTTLYLNYSQGLTTHAWAPKVAEFPFEHALRVKQRLIAQDNLAVANSVSGWARFTQISPNGPCMIGLAVGMALVLLFSFCRLRFNKWPLHPVVFLTWATYPGWIFGWSFLIGWLIKTLVTKYGGAGVYQKLKPLMIGVIAGELLGAIVPFLVGLIYYFITGEQAPRYQFMPG